MLLWWYINAAKLNAPTDPAFVRLQILRGIAPTIVFAISIPIALVDATAGKLFWFALIPANIFVERRVGQDGRRARVARPERDTGSMTSGHSLSTEPSGERVRVAVARRDARRHHERRRPARDRAAAALLPAPGRRPHGPSRADRPPRPTARSRATPSTGPRSSSPADVVDIAWSYPTPIADREDITELVCFFNERVDELIVGETVEERPQTQWSEQADLQPHPEV